jgi:hypothetical protein
MGSGYIDPIFLDLGISWRWLFSFTPQPLYLREKARGTHSIGGWVGARAGLDNMEEWKFLTLPGLELRPLGHPARSQSLYRLRYPGSLIIMQIVANYVLMWGYTRCIKLLVKNLVHVYYGCNIVCTYVVFGIMFGGITVIKYVSWLVYWRLIVNFLLYYDVVCW